VELPTLAQAAKSRRFQLALLNHEFPDDVVRLIDEGAEAPEFAGLLRLVLLACYLLDRVALTAVRGKNEDYAFTVFESLNTTGEPLTAFETFKPRVVSAEGLERYEGSQARLRLDRVSDYLSRFKVGEPLQVATRELLIMFAATETGTKLSQRLADQRRYLKDEFERYEKSEAARLAFVQNLCDVTMFVERAWDAGTEQVPLLDGLPIEATTDTVKLCLAFLNALGHSVTVGVLARFYSVALAAADDSREKRAKEFEAAIKAVTAFSILWRASRRTTGGIDDEYRQILNGTDSLAGLARLSRAQRRGSTPETKLPELNVSTLKAELRARLADPKHGGIADRSRFLTEAATLPIYEISRPVTRMMLLSAYHDAVEDTSEPGLIKKGRPAVSPCLTYEGFRDSRHLSLEHIAPQVTSAGWSNDLWTNKETAHRIGNLVLVQSDANSSLGNRPWAQKRVLYAALSAPTHAEAENILAESGFDFGEDTRRIAEMSAHMLHLAAVSRRSGDWDAAFVARRSERLLELVWDTLVRWLT
jgi:hypothetical protein